MNLHEYLKLKKALGGGGASSYNDLKDKPFLIVNVKAVDEDRFYNGEDVELLLDRTGEEIYSAFNNGVPVVFLVYGVILHLHTAYPDGFRCAGVRWSNQILCLSLECWKEEDKWVGCALDDADWYDHKVVGLYIYGDDNRRYRISVNNGTITATNVRES